MAFTFINWRILHYVMIYKCGRLKVNWLLVYQPGVRWMYFLSLYGHNFDKLNISFRHNIYGERHIPTKDGILIAEL